MIEMKKSEKELTEELLKKADASQNEEKADKVKKIARGNVTVFCAIPMGIRLPIKGGEVKLDGKPMSHIVSAKKGEGFLPAGKYGETVVTAEQWEEIKHTYAKYDFMLNGAIFAKENIDEGRELAEEKSEKNLGFDQADPKKGRTRKKSKED